MVYILVLEPSLYKLRVYLVLHRIMLSGVTISVMYSVYADNISTLVISKVEIEEVGKESQLYETSKNQN